MTTRVGSIISIVSEKSRYRIVAILNDSITMCKMDITKLELIEISKKAFFQMELDGKIVITNDSETRIHDVELLSESARRRFLMKKDAFRRILDIYGPEYLDLCGKNKKEELYKILDEYNYPKSTFWKNCVRYFQSGMDERTLIDGKAFGNNKGKEYYHTAKSGRKSEYGEVGVPLSQRVLDCFGEALKEYKDGRKKSIKSCYDYMNSIYFSRTEVIDGVPTMCLLPANERPTYKQFCLYVAKHISKEEKSIIKTSRMEHRNNERLLTSDSLYGVLGPGDMVEIDACEADVSLVSMIDKNQTIGRPIVYFMIDVFSRIILAMSIAFDNNSNLGVTSLFLNLGDDKREYCEKFGISYKDERIWPSNIIPNRLRVDRGAEVKSREFGRICNALGIQKDIVSGGSGSLKGVVEQSFRLMHLNQNEFLENHGLIEKRYDSKHHKEATMNIEQYTKMVICFVLSHNQKCLEEYPLTKDMLEKNISAIPAMLWQYGIKHLVSPRPIINKLQFIYELMTPIKVTVSRKGLNYKGLYYYTDDPDVTTMMFKAGNKKISVEARMDMRDVGAIYWIKGNTLIQIPLNDRIAGNIDYAGMTIKQYEEYRKKKGQLSANGRIHNEELAAYTNVMNRDIVREVSKASDTLANDKNMRQAREREKQQVSRNNAIMKRLKTDKKSDDREEVIIEDKAEKERNLSRDLKEESSKDYFYLSEAELLEEQKKALDLFDDED